MTKYLFLLLCSLFNISYASQSQEKNFNPEASQQLLALVRNPFVAEEKLVKKKIKKLERLSVEQSIDKTAIIDEETFNKHKDFLINNQFIRWGKEDTTNNYWVIPLLDGYLKNPSIEKVISLLKANADPNYSNDNEKGLYWFKTTALFELSTKEELSTELMQLLIDHKAQINRSREFFENNIKNKKARKNNNEQLITLINITLDACKEVPTKFLFDLVYFNPSTYVAAQFMNHFLNRAEINRRSYIAYFCCLKEIKNKTHMKMPQPLRLIIFSFVNPPEAIRKFIATTDSDDKLLKNVCKTKTENCFYNLDEHKKAPFYYNFSKFLTEVEETTYQSYKDVRNRINKELDKK